MSKFRGSFSLSLVVLALLGVTMVGLSQSATGKLPEKPAVLLFPPKDAKFFSLGYDEMFADLLWLRTVQDFDMCEQSSRAPGQNFTPWADGTSSETRREKSRCENGWVYQMLDTITELAPRFYAPYKHGATMLSVLVDDREGARKIFEKAVQRFPGDWQLHYRLGYHYLYEIHDLEKAARELELAAKAGAPQWVYALVGRIYLKSGQVDLGISVLEEVQHSIEDPEALARVQRRLKELKALKASSND